MLHGDIRPKERLCHHVDFRDPPPLLPMSGGGVDGSPCRMSIIKMVMSPCQGCVSAICRMAI